MLTLRRAVAAAVLACGLILIGGVHTAALADPPAECDPTTDPWCSIDDEEPGKPDDGDDDGGTGGGGCAWQGVTMPCTDPDFGTWVGGGCYWQALNPPINADPPPGKNATKGQWGARSCYTAPTGGRVEQAYQWMDSAEVGLSPQELAQQALAKLRLRGAQIGVAPDPNSKGAVGLPVWLWTPVTPGTWGPQRASASAGAVTVSIEAKAHTIVWQMGDGNSVTCTNPGQPYKAAYGLAESTMCGYKYPRPSITAANPNGRYTITATTHWRVTWTGGGQTGVLTPTSQSQTSVQIGEIQVVKR